MADAPPRSGRKVRREIDASTQALACALRTGPNAGRAITVVPVMNERWRDTYDQWKTASPYEITAEQEAKLEREERECRYCDGSGFFYSEPDLGPCDCVLQASEPATSLGENDGR